MKKKPEVMSLKPKQTETSLQKRLFELHAKVDARSDEEQALRVFIQSAKPKEKLWKKNSRRR